MGLDGGGDVKDLSSLRPLASSVFLLARGISVPQLHPSACQRGLLDPENSLPPLLVESQCLRGFGGWWALLDLNQ